MSRFSEWYHSQIRRVHVADTEHTAGNRQRAHERHIKRQRTAGYKKIDQQMKDLRRPDETPPWEKQSSP